MREGGRVSGSKPRYSFLVKRREMRDIEKRYTVPLASFSVKIPWIEPKGRQRREASLMALLSRGTPLRTPRRGLTTPPIYSAEVGKRALGGEQVKIASGDQDKTQPRVIDSLRRDLRAVRSNPIALPPTRSSHSGTKTGSLFFFLLKKEKAVCRIALIMRCPITVCVTPGGT